MCGIAGALSTKDCRDVVQKLTDSLIHRGPDDGGLADLTGRNGVTHGTFGNRRLAILDLSPAGHQPMWSPDGRLCLSYNGEIYNFREIRSELEREGSRFQSTGDTAVILEGWARWGPEILRRLRGMFALSLWDRDAECCYLARDVFGIKPLYVAESAGMVMFASEIRALLASDRISRTMSVEAVRSFLQTGSVAEPLTIIESIDALPAGCFVTIDCRRGAPVIGEPQQFDSVFRSSQTEARTATPADLRQALRDSVQHHLVSDVPVALFLSGGLDSSSVVGVASEVSQATLDTFTVTFDDARYSEAEPAREVARKFKTSHHEIPFTGSDLLNALPGAFAAMDQPSLDGLNTYVVSRAVHDNGIKVVLSGLGGDELFGGYPSFPRAQHASRLWRFRPFARRFLSGASELSSDPRINRLNGMFADTSPALGAYRASRTLFDDVQVSHLLLATAQAGEWTERRSVPEPQLSLLQQVSFYETTGYMRNTLLRDSDVFSMAHSLEMRVPFVDREVASVAMLFRDAEKLARGRSKPLLVEAVKDLLPPSLFERRKQGFTLPFERWMRHEMFREVDSVLTSPKLSSVGLAHEEVARTWADFQSRRRGVNWSRPWALYTLKRWAEQNSVIIDDITSPTVSLAQSQ